MIKMGIIGAGGIAVKMAETVAAMEQVQNYAIAARELSRAERFGKQYGFVRAYGSYEEMLGDENVDLVYIAVPHSHHYKYTKLALEAGKHVLCEKAFTVDAEEAVELCKLAKEKKLLLTEAIWTRYMPSRKMICDRIERGVIGEPTSLTANLCYVLPDSQRLWDPALAGGALLDLGVYPINFASMVFGDKVKSVNAQAVFRHGVDMSNSITMVFGDGKIASLQSNAMALSNRMGAIFGTKGYIEVININNPEKINVYDSQYRQVESVTPPPQITGYEYEVEACVKAIEAGAVECKEMPHEETIRIMKIMDGIRRDWGYEIPKVR